MFVPSESVFAEIHENFEAVVQKAHRARVVIVSPSLLMLSIQVVQAILKDARMREQAHLIQGEVVRLMEDLGRLDERVRKLQTHFLQASKDIDDILVSSAQGQPARPEDRGAGVRRRRRRGRRARTAGCQGRPRRARCRFQDRAAQAARRRRRRGLARNQVGACRQPASTTSRCRRCQVPVVCGLTKSA